MPYIYNIYIYISHFCKTNVLAVHCKYIVIKKKSNFMLITIPSVKMLTSSQVCFKIRALKCFVYSISVSPRTGVGIYH